MMLRPRHVCAVAAIVVGLSLGYLAASENNYVEANVARVASVLAFALAFFALFGRGARR